MHHFVTHMCTRVHISVTEWFTVVYGDWCIVGFVRLVYCACAPWILVDKANLEDLIAATGLVILLKLDSNRRFISPCDLEIWWITSKNFRAPLRHYIKLCASSQTARWIPTGVIVRKLSIRVKIGDFWSRETLKIDGWPWNTLEHLFYATLSSVHHFKAIDEFKLELQSGNAQFGSKLGDLLSRVTLKFDGWPWKTIGHLYYVASSMIYDCSTRPSLWYLNFIAIPSFVCPNLTCIE